MTKSVLVISHDKVGPSMAGPGIRYHQIATELSKHFDVTLSTFNPDYLEGLHDTSYQFFDINANQFEEAFDQFDVIFALWLSPDMIAYAKKKKIILIFDLYAPVPVEELVARVYSHKIDKASDYDYSVALQNYRNFFANGDYFVCSNPIQKDFWVGYAFSSGSNLPSIQKDFSVYDRIGLLPMGIDLDELKGNRLVKDLLRKDFPSIKKEDFVIVWTGGIWDWFDAETPIRAIKHLVDQGNTEVKLVFLGTKHPNTEVPEMSESTKAYMLAKELGILNSNVFFREGWIPYTSRLGYLLKADVALYAHKPSVEARYSHRTRVLDHFLCSLPTISTSGDYLGDSSAAAGMGIAVEPENVSEMAQTIGDLVANPDRVTEMRHTITANQHEFIWEVSCAELVEFIKNVKLSRPIVIPPKLVGTPGKLQKKVRKVIPQPIKNGLKKVIPR